MFQSSFKCIFVALCRFSCVSWKEQHHSDSPIPIERPYFNTFYCDINKTLYDF